MPSRYCYYYTHLELDFLAAVDVLGDDPGTWLPPPASAEDDSWVVTLHANGALPESLARLDTLVGVGPTITTEECRLVRPVTWRARPAEKFFPVLHADLELERLEGRGCQLSLRGSYRPPLPVFGELGDRMVGRRVAEACVRRFVLDIGCGLNTHATES